MKKFFTLLMMSLMAIGTWAGEVTFTPAEFVATTSADYSLEKSGITMAVTASTVTADQFRIFKGQKITFSSSAGNINKIVFTCTANGTAKYGPGCFAAQDGYTFESDGKTGTWVGSATEVSFTSESNQVRATQIVVTFGEGGAVETKKATVIEFAEGYATRATCGKDEQVDLPVATVKAGDDAVQGASVTWTSGNEELAKIENGALSIPNQVQGQVKITAAYAGDDNYQSSTKNYTLTIYKGYGLLSELVLDANSTNEKWDNGGEYASYWFVDLDNGMKSVTNTVTFANGKYVYLSDGTNNLLFYGNNELNLKQGDVVSGDLGEGKLGAVWGNLYRYNKLPELSFTEMELKVVSEGATVEPKTISADAISENINAYVKIENAEFVSADGKNVTFKAGDANLAVYNQFGVAVDDLVAGTKYTVLGMGAVYRENYQLYLISVVNGESQHIASVSADKNHNAIYNLQGQRLQKTQKGLNIVGGKKLMVK